MKAYEKPNYRQIKVTFVGPTNTRGSRIKIYEPIRYSDEKVKSKIFSYDYSIGNVEDQAFKILSENGFNIVGRASDLDNYIFLCNNWGEDFKQVNELVEHRQ